MDKPESNFFFHFLLVCLFLLSPAAFGDAEIVTDSAYLFHICRSFDSYTADSPYASNLNQAFDQLASNVPPSGFGLTTVGKDLRNQVNGLALCRGDVSAADCENCVVMASQEIQQKCPYRKVAAIWYDFCFLKYSYIRFFGKINNRNKFYMWNVRKVEDDAPFNKQVRSLLTSLSVKVQTMKELYAIDQLEIKPSKKLYGLVQCTRDLSGAACKNCLESAIGELSSFADGKIGGRVVSGSCNFRYELYPTSLIPRNNVLCERMFNMK